MPKIERKYLIKELERELVMRKRFFPQWIVSGKITKAVAEHRIACIEQMLKDYKDEKFTGQPVGQGNLF